MSAVWTRSTRAPQENGPPDHKSVGGRHMHALLSGGFEPGELAGPRRTPGDVTQPKRLKHRRRPSGRKKKAGGTEKIGSCPLVACSRAAGSL